VQVSHLKDVCGEWGEGDGEGEGEEGAGEGSVPTLMRESVELEEDTPSLLSSYMLLYMLAIHTLV
jgi:hypothetical protein